MIRRLDSFEKFGDTYLLQLLEPPGVPEGTREFRILVIRADGAESIFGIYRQTNEHAGGYLQRIWKAVWGTVRPDLVTADKTCYIGPEAERRALRDWETEQKRVQRFVDMEDRIKAQHEAADKKTPEIAGTKATCTGCKAETDNFVRDRWWTSQVTGEFVCPACKKPGDFPHGLFLTLSPDEQVAMTNKVIEERMSLLSEKAR